MNIHLKKPEDPELTKDSPASSSTSARLELLMMREAEEQMGKQEYQAAADTFESILKRFRVALEDDQLSLIHSELGTLYYWLGDYDAAQKHCEDALAFGNNDHAYAVLGKLAVAKFQFTKARGYFSKISDDNPARSLGLCLVSIKLRDSLGAESFLREASAKVSKTDPEFRTYQAYFLIFKGASAQAVAASRELLPKCEKDPALVLLLAEIFMTAGHFGEAASAARKVKRACPQNDGVFAILAHSAFAEENLQDAEAQAREAVRLNPWNAYAKTVLMKLATRSGSYATAEDIGMQILKDSPEYSLARANLGDVYFNQGRYELAQIEYEQTFELMKADTKGARLRQARMKFINGDYHSAAEILEHLIEAEKHTYYDDAMCDLALSYDQLRDEAKKAELLEKMQLRRDFYYRTEKILRQFGEA